MREHPIAFNGTKVPALRDGSKAQTRHHGHDTGMYAMEAGVHGGTTAARELVNRAMQCPYDRHGDRLWVREPWRTAADLDKHSGSKINHVDAIAEGVDLNPSASDVTMTTPHGESLPRLTFRALWNQINGPDSWDATPWIWVVEFRRIR